MVFSKLWFFVVAVLAVVAGALALTMPRPAERRILESEDERLARARREIDFLMDRDAHARLLVGLSFARRNLWSELGKIKAERDTQDEIPAALHASARATLGDMLNEVGDKKDFLVLVDAWGRVVARSDGDDFGDDLSGFFLVRDTLVGNMRDDLWLGGNKLNLVVAVPVISRPDIESGPDAYVGALIVGRAIDEEFANGLATRVSSNGPSCAPDTCDTKVAFFGGGNVMANSGAPTVASDIKAEFAKRKDHGDFDKKDGQGAVLPAPPFTVASDKPYQVAAKRLPGEAGAEDAFFAVYSARPGAIGFGGTLKSVVKGDVSFKNFPWLRLAFAFVFAMLVGLGLMWWESDRPRRRLLKEALALAQGNLKQFTEGEHRGAYGSIARSVNLALERLVREGRERSDGNSTDTRALPPSPPIGAPPPPPSFAPPPPSDFSLDVRPNAPRVPVNPVSSVAHGAGFEFEIPPAPGPAPSPSPNVRRGTASIIPPSMSLDEPDMPIMPPVQSASVRVPIAAPSSQSASVRAPIAAPSSQSASVRAPIAPSASGRVAPIAIPPPPPMEAKKSPPPTPQFLSAPTPPPPPTSVSNMTPKKPPGPVASLDDDILGGQAAADPPAMIGDQPSMAVLRDDASADREATYFKQVYEDFVELKKKCGESVDGLTYDKFAAKLRTNRDQLVAKYACKAVKFQVYVKDGKAALKATPVKT